MENKIYHFPQRAYSREKKNLVRRTARSSCFGNYFGEGAIFQREPAGMFIHFFLGVLGY